MVHYLAVSNFATSLLNRVVLGDCQIGMGGGGGGGEIVTVRKLLVK